MLIVFVDMMSTVLDNPVIFLAEAALSKDNEVGIVKAEIHQRKKVDYSGKKSGRTAVGGCRLRQVGSDK